MECDLSIRAKRYFQLCIPEFYYCSKILKDHIPYQFVILLLSVPEDKLKIIGVPTTEPSIFIISLLSHENY